MLERIVLFASVSIPAAAVDAAVAPLVRRSLAAAADVAAGRPAAPAAAAAHAACRRAWRHGPEAMKKITVLLPQYNLKAGFC